MENIASTTRRDFIENIDTANEEIERLDAEVTRLFAENERLKHGGTSRKSASEGKIVEKPVSSSGLSGLQRAIAANIRGNNR